MKLNNLSRLTALLLALTMFLSSVAWADPVAEGDYTADNYAEMLAAQTDTCATCVNEMTNGDFPTTDHKGNTISITCSYEYLKGLGSPMERYNFLDYVYNTLLDSTGFAALYTTHEQHVEDGAPSLLCTCPDRANTDLRVPGPENHAETCPWVDDTVVIIPPLRYEQPEPLKPELFEQYASNNRIDLSVWADRVVVLPALGRATLETDLADGYQWQVFDGNVWVDIEGENNSDLIVTGAKLASIWQLTDIAQLRYYDATNSVVLATAYVTSEEIANGEYVEPVAEAAQGLSLISKEGEETAEVVTITVRFEYSDMLGNPAPDKTYVLPKNLEGYTVNNVAAGKVVVELPNVLGYEPTFNPSDAETTPPTLDAENLTLTLAAVNVDATKTYIVRYVPAKVGFTITPHLQNLTDDNYTADTANSLIIDEGRTNATVGLYRNQIMQAVGEEYPGFTMLLFETDELIAADGSTNIEIYLDRNYYLMKFDLGDGGYGMDPIYARYEAPLTVTDPTRPGYTFLNWKMQGDTSDKVYTSAELSQLTMPVGGATYVAQWDMVDSAKVTYVIWGENADDEGYSYVKTLEDTATPGTKVSFYTCGEHQHTTACGYACGLEEHQHTTECYSCGQTEHTHGAGCYTASHGSLSSSPVTGNTLNTLNSSSPNANGVYRIEGDWWSYTYYYKIGDSFYQINNVNLGWGGDWNDITVTLSCTQTAHTHGSGCAVDCGYTAHTHSASCGYDCGIDSDHVHDDSCYLNANMDEDLWTLVQSDEVTVNPDGSTVVNVYYDRVTYNIRFYRSTNANLNNYIYIIEAKWGQNISSHWPIKNATDNNDYTNARWDDEGTTSLYDEVLVFIEIMPAESFRLYYSSTNNSIKTMYYYVEALPGAEYEATYTYSGTTKYFVKAFEELKPYYGMFTEDEDFFPLRGFDKWTSNPQYTNGQVTNQSTIRHYYTRHTYSIVFYNPTELIKTETGVPYEAELGVYNFEPTPEQAPAQYEPGSVEFVGWYLNPECTGDEYILEDNTMPAGEKNGEITLSLYAKWVPVTKTITFYLDEAALNATPSTPLTGDGFGEREVPFGTIYNSAYDGYQPVGTPERGEDQFIGWFYKDENGVEKAFDFNTMPVKRDLQLYGKWSTNVMVDFVIKYHLANADGTDSGVEVAADTVGQILNGHLRTFYPKIEGDLYAEYQTGYYPMVASHSLTVDANDPTKNTYTFLYKKADGMPYTVYYVTETENKVYNGQQEETVTVNGTTYYRLRDDKPVNDNTHTVVTENYVHVEGYLPKNKEYQKVLILSHETEKNVIIFVYEANADSTSYIVTHYFEDANGTVTWTNEDQETKQYRAGIQDIRPALVGDQITVPFNSISGYEPAGSNYDRGNYTSDAHYGATTATVVITENEGQVHFHLYYNEVNATFGYYVAMGQGTVSPGSETLKVISGTPQGSVATAAPGYVFDGWYLDPECTVPVGTAGTVTDGHIVPKPNAYYPRYVLLDDGTTQTTQVPGYAPDSFYAKFVEQEVTINYRIIDPDGNVYDVDQPCGHLDSYSENLLAVSGAASGSTGTVSSNVYKFVGWYIKDAEENYVPVQTTDGTVDGNKFTPIKEENSLWIDGTTYYALFEYNLTSMTIWKAAAEGTTISSDETFIFTVTGPGLENGLKVIVQGTGSVVIGGLTVGQEYTVTEDTNWSWRYGEVNPVEIKLAPSNNKVVITNSKTEHHWLSDEGTKVNKFNEQKPQGGEQQ